MLRTATVCASGHRRILRVSPGAEETSLFGVPRREEDTSAWSFTGARCQRIGLGNLQERDRSRAVIVRAVEHTVSIRAVVIEMCAQDDPLVFQLRVRSLDRGHDVAIVHDVALDACGDAHPMRRDGNWLDPSPGLGCPCELD